jgi:hypothetical protein
MDHRVEALTVKQRLCPEAHADLDQLSPSYPGLALGRPAEALAH